MIEPGLVALLETLGDVYPLKLPPKPALPAIVYQLIDNPRDYTHEGPSGIAFPYFQVSYWAQDTEDASGYQQAIALAEAGRALLSGYSGTLDDVVVRGAFLVHEADDDDPETGWSRRRQDWSFRTVESV